MCKKVCSCWLWALLIVGFAAAYGDVTLDPAKINRVLNGIVFNLKEYYVYPEVAQRMIDALQAHEKAPDYQNIRDPAAFADLLTKQLQDVSHDRHLRVVYNPAVASAPPRAPEDDAEFRKFVERRNCAFANAEILPDNIGYLKLDAFAPFVMSRYRSRRLRVSRACGRPDF